MAAPEHLMRTEPAHYKERSHMNKFATWKQRGLVLLGKLCTSYNLSRGESEQVRKYFMAVWKDVFDIAKNVCLEKKSAKEGSPRDLGGLISEKIAELGTYTGYY